MESLLSLSTANSIFGAVLCAVQERNKFKSKRTVWEIIQRKTRKTDCSTVFFFIQTAQLPPFSPSLLSQQQLKTNYSTIFSWPTFFPKFELQQSEHWLDVTKCINSCKIRGIQRRFCQRPVTDLLNDCYGHENDIFLKLLLRLAIIAVRGAKICVNYMSKYSISISDYINLKILT